MLKITSNKLAQYQYPGGYLEPHLRPPSVEYETDKRVTVQIDGDKSETGMPYIAYVNAQFNPSDGWLENATIEEMEPAIPGQWEAVPNMSSDEWTQKYWQDIDNAATP